jgi:hypothetical protein
MIKKSNDRTTNCLYTALLELKTQQDQLDGCPTSCFSTLLSKLFKVDTIPFLLYTKQGLLHLAGFEYSKQTGDCQYFHTTFYRIEYVEGENKCVILSLLRPLTLDGSPAEDILGMERLERTNIYVTVDLSYVCGVQCLDIDLTKKIVIEPKW